MKFGQRLDTTNMSTSWPAACRPFCLSTEVNFPNRSNRLCVEALSTCKLRPCQKLEPRHPMSPMIVDLMITFPYVSAVPKVASLGRQSPNRSDVCWALPTCSCGAAEQQLDTVLNAQALKCSKSGTKQRHGTWSSIENSFPDSLWLVHVNSQIMTIHDNTQLGIVITPNQSPNKNTGAF